MEIMISVILSYKYQNMVSGEKMTEKFVTHDYSFII